jgi:hypothetical protein
MYGTYSTIAEKYFNIYDRRKMDVFEAKKQFVIVFQNFWTQPSIIGHKSKTLRPKSILRRSFSCKYMSKFYNQSLGHLTEKKTENFSPLKFCSPNSLVRGRITKVGEEI